MSRPLFLPPAGWVREPTVLSVVPFGRTKLREEVAAGRFPSPRKFSDRVVAYDAAAVHDWIAAQREAQAEPDDRNQAGGNERRS